MNNDSLCFWNRGGICAFDLTVPGSQVACLAAGCRDYEQKLSSEDYKNGDEK